MSKYVQMNYRSISSNNLSLYRDLFINMGATEEKFCLKWNDFSSNASKSFGLLRNEEYLHDVTLICDDNSQVSAHKLVLSACSEYFKTIFRNNGNQRPLICLEGITLSELKNILDYMYNGEAKIFQENLERFLALASRLRVSGLLQNDNEDSMRFEGTKAEENTDFEVDITTDADKLNKNDVYTTKTFGKTGQIKNCVPGQVIKAVSINNGDQKEINRKVDEHIETCSDGTLKCTLCGKVEAGRKNKSQNMRGHVETHLEGISYQCQFCEENFRSRFSLSQHKYRNHK